jgi:hypothetical protein
MLKIERTSHTPEIEIDQTSFKMSGICTPENPPKFFDEFNTEFENLICSEGNTELIFHLDYFNTGSSKCLLNLFKFISLNAKPANIKITWAFEAGDEEMKESGELYSEIAEMKFNYLELDK